MSTQCEGITKYKTQCLNYSKTSNYCHLHQNQKKIVIEVEECPVCLNEINSQLSCGHKVHTSCVVKSGKPECPLCRQNVELSAIDINKMLLYEMKYSITDIIELRNQAIRIILSSTCKSIPLDMLFEFLNELGVLYLFDNVVGFNKHHEIYHLD
jgi:hypothetical protein